MSKGTSQTHGLPAGWDQFNLSFIGKCKIHSELALTRAKSSLLAQSSRKLLALGIYWCEKIPWHYFEPVNIFKFWHIFLILGLLLLLICGSKAMEAQTYEWKYGSCFIIIAIRLGFKSFCTTAKMQYTATLLRCTRGLVCRHWWKYDVWYPWVMIDPFL